MSKFTPEQKLTLIKHLAGGKSLEVVATIMHSTKDAILDVAKNHGYPDFDKLAWAADVMAKNLEENPAGINPAPLAQVPLAEQRPTPPRPGDQPRQVEPVADDVLAVLNKAKGHRSKRIQSAADKALDAIAKVRQLVADDELRNAERRKAEREKAAAKAEVDRLERELATAKAKLRGKPAENQPKAATGGEFGCDECERTFASPAGLGIHKGRTHTQAVA